ncbi:AAA-like domain-containing protein [Candidatus Woesearchaeota archaeon]|nr:AAA-like domain-containing protein [Candidatus Woesearchaeota archaeon]
MGETTIEDKFVVKGPVGATIGIFANRDDLLGIQRNILRGEWVSLTGPRQFGKTSILKALERTYSQTYDTVPVFMSLEEFCNDFLDALSAETMSTNFGNAMRRITTHVYERLVERKMLDDAGLSFKNAIASYDGSRSLGDFLKDLQGAIDNPGDMRVAKMRENKARALLLFDEYNNLRGKVPEFLSHLRFIFGASEHGTRRPIQSCVIADQQDAATISLGSTSPYNISRTVILRDLTEETSNKIIRDGLQPQGVKVEDGAYNRIYYWSGGHPCLVQRMGSYCVKELNKRNIKTLTPQLVDEASEHFVYAGDDHLSALSVMLAGEEKISPGIVSAFTEFMGGQSIQLMLSRPTHAKLYKLGLVVRQDEDDFRSPAKVRNPIYERHFRSLMDSGQPPFPPK